MESEPKEIYLKAPWGNIALVSWYEGPLEPVLLVHGRTDSAATFSPLVERLPRTRRYVAVDLPGNGKSDSFPKGLTVSRYHFLGVIDYVVRYLGWRNFAFLGHSMGCEIGLYFNAVRPGLISSFIHLDPSPSFQRLQQPDPVYYYNKYFHKYYSNYYRYNNDNSKKYTKKEAVTAVMKARQLSEQQANTILSRNLIFVGDDKYRLSWDPRNKSVVPQVISNDDNAKIFSTNRLASLLISMSDGHAGVIRGKDGAEQLVRRLMAEGNIRKVELEGGHDHHVTHPEEVATLRSKLILHNEKELILQVPWGKLTALCWGSPTDAPVLLCHGRLDACSSFRPLAQALPPERFYVSVELPGNGRSDRYPRGGALHVTDYLPPLDAVMEHFKWKKYTFIGHSLGVSIGKYLNHIYPGKITRMVDIDPEPAYVMVKNNLPLWYKYYYGNTFYGSEAYHKLNGSLETAPKYTYEQIRDKMMKARRLTEEQVEHILERSLEPTEDGLYRINYDQRFKFLMYQPFLYESLHKFYTDPKTPTLGIFATESIARGCYKAFPFAMDDKAWPHGNYKHVVMEGAHDIHLQKPEEVASHITEFFKNNPE